MMKKLLGVPYDVYTRREVLEKIKKYLRRRDGVYHIVSVNPEIVLRARNNKSYLQTIRRAQIRIVDGVGIVVAARILGLYPPHRLQGVDLMVDMLKVANELRLTVMLIGSGPKIADRVVECQKSKFPRTSFLSLRGIANIRNPTGRELKKIFAIVARNKPHFVFVAFGSPMQELFIDRHKGQFEGSVVMGVGGAFDFLSGSIPRAPRWVCRLGFEWFFRLFYQPRRISRQIKLLQFISLVIRERISQTYRRNGPRKQD